MIDIHSHIIFGVDDGASNINESLRMVAAAARLGVKTIIATPHYQTGIFESGSVRNNFAELVQKAEKMEVQLLLGYEVYFDAEILRNISVKGLDLNNSAYVLTELPYGFVPGRLEEMLYQLQIRGYRPILAHPERNKELKSDMFRLKMLKEMGCQIQLDAGSILGVHGSTSRAFSKRVIKAGIADFVASDAHNAEDYRSLYTAAYKKVAKWVGTAYADRVFVKNALPLIARR